MESQFFFFLELNWFLKKVVTIFGLVGVYNAALDPWHVWFFALARQRVGAVACTLVFKTRRTKLGTGSEPAVKPLWWKNINPKRIILYMVQTQHFSLPWKYHLHSEIWWRQQHVMGILYTSTAGENDQKWGKTFLVFQRIETGMEVHLSAWRRHWAYCNTFQHYCTSVELIRFEGVSVVSLWGIDKNTSDQMCQIERLVAVAVLKKDLLFIYFFH